MSTTYESLLDFEANLGFELPSLYKEILLNPPGCVIWYWAGSSWGYPEIAELTDLPKVANELLDVVGEQLEQGDFVFYMHQGYTFWYMKNLKGNGDPEIWEFTEGDAAPHKIGDSFTAWFNAYCRAVEEERTRKEDKMKAHFEQMQAKR
jgi:SMI1-KNR4 cell-wall